MKSSTALVEVAKASTEAIASLMKEMASVTKETKSNKLEVQLKLLYEQMVYQQERYTRMHEQSLIVAYNARLTIIKQGEIVFALGNISSVLSLGFKGHPEPPSPPPQGFHPSTCS